MILACFGFGCNRMISVSQIAGGNPIALQDPKRFSTKFMVCEDCKKNFCDRCVAKRRQHLRAPRCHYCHGKLFEGECLEVGSRPWPDAVIRCRAGIGLVEEGEYGGALDVLDEVVRLRPEYVSAHFYRGIALRELVLQG